MGQNSGIEWTDHTFNPWVGCAKVSPACKHCYAERDMDHRFGRVAWGEKGTRSRTSDVNWRLPLSWERQAAAQGRFRVFCASLADVFENWEGPILDHNGRQLFTINGSDYFTEGEYPECRPATMDDLRRDLFTLIDATPHLDWLLLTKRPENIPTMIPPRIRPDCQRCHGDGCDPDEWLPGFGMAPCPCRLCIGRHNLLLGTSVENQEWAEKRIHHLLRCRGMARVLFLSCEPLLGPVDLRQCWLPDKTGFHNALDGRLTVKAKWDDGSESWVRTTDGVAGRVSWVIVGGESGPNARPSNPDWFRSLRDQCQEEGVPFHFKQWGEWCPEMQCEAADTFRSNDDRHYHSWPGVTAYRVGKKKAGRKLDGRTWDEFPQPAVTS